MNREQIAVLLKSLADRVRSDTSSGALTVEISSFEKSALELAAVHLSDNVVPDTAAKSRGYQLNLDCTRITSAESKEILLCLDFGTATSKAFARRVDNYTLLPLPIGVRAGQTEPAFALVSSMYITLDKKILFGQRAVTASLVDREYGRQRIDSMKDILAKGDVKLALGESFLDRRFNQTDIPLREIDVLSLYLGYLTDIATTELSERHQTSRYVKRRFSLPVFDAVRSEWANRYLGEVVAKAQVLADTFHGRWDIGIDLVEAKAALDELQKLPAPVALVDPKGVTEPIAAIASRIRGEVQSSAGKRQLFAVIDVGAGTIDFALFFRVPVRSGEGFRDRFYLVPGTEKVLRQAGNQVDAELKAFMLKRAGVRESQSDFGRIDAALSLDVRYFKESLFKGNGTEVYTLVNDRRVEVDRDKFVQSRGILVLEKQIHSKFEEMLRAADESWINGIALVDLVALVTGGGADLPFVRSLEQKTIVIGRPIQVRIGTPRPRYIEEDYPQLSPEYPRLAVALGGSSSELPELAPKQFGALGASQVINIPDVVRKGN